MLYIIDDNFNKRDVLKHIESIKPGEGRRQCVEIKAFVNNRSVSQNRTYWMWLNEISECVGMHSEDLHEQLKARILGVQEVRIPRYFMGQDYGEPKIIIKPKSTKSLDVNQFSEYMFAVEELAKEMGIVLPMPDDIKLSMEGVKV